MARLITHASQDERISSIMRTQRVHRLQRRQAADHVPQHEPSAARAATSTCGRARPGSSRRPATAWRRCCACRRAAHRSRWSCSARARTPAASWKRATCSTGLPRRPSTLFAAKPVTPTAAVTRQKEPRRPRDRRADRSLRSLRSPRFLLYVYPVYPRCIAAASSGSVAIVSTATITGALRVPGVVRLEIAAADVAGVDAVAAVARGERRDQRAVVVRAERAGQRREAPLRDAAAADQPPIGARRDHREVRLPAADRAVAVVPAASDRPAAPAPRRSAPGTAAAPAPAPDRGRPARRPAAGCRGSVARLDAGRGVVPARRRAARARCRRGRARRCARGRRARAPRSAAGCRRSGAASAGSRSTRAGCRRSAPAAVRPPAARGAHAGSICDPRQRHAPLDAALHVDQRDLHVDGGRQLRLGGLQLLELDDFARFGARRTRRAIRSVANWWEDRSTGIC